jgi:hypothetical protein
MAMTRHVHTVPSPDAARRARRELVGQRAQGHPFEVAWPAALSAATRGLSPTSAREWRCALVDTEWAWRDAYAGQGCVIALFMCDPEHRERAAA